MRRPMHRPMRRTITRLSTLALVAAHGCAAPSVTPSQTPTTAAAATHEGVYQAAPNATASQGEPAAAPPPADASAIASTVAPPEPRAPIPVPQKLMAHPTSGNAAPRGSSLAALGGNDPGSARDMAAVVAERAKRSVVAHEAKGKRDAERDRPEADDRRIGHAEPTPQVNGLVHTREDPLSTFAIDVDTGSYTLARRALEQGSLPSASNVRVEEWVNAFHYSYPDDAGAHPFSIHLEAAPLAKQSHVLRIGIQGKRIAKAERDPVHLTFLVDVSGSMQGPDRLPLAQQSLEMLVDELGPRDSVSLVTYAGSTGVVLPSMPVRAENKGSIKHAIRSLTSGGGTNMGSGMELAYREAGKALGEKGISRVIVLSDGDANIGRTSHEDILKSIRGYVSEGVTLSTVGFGTGNYRDDMMERLADAGNGNYSYVGSQKDAQRIFVDDVTGTLQVIAKDTKIQVEMNPDVVEQYRLIGYENRDVADKDFRNDKVDAGEIGAGHTVTALYEVTLRSPAPTTDIATVRVRYKQPRGTKAQEVARTFAAARLAPSLADLSNDGRFAVGVALAAEAFRNSPHMARLGLSLDDAARLLQGATQGPHGAERAELAALVAPFASGAPVAAQWLRAGAEGR